MSTRSTQPNRYQPTIDLMLGRTIISIDGKEGAEVLSFTDSEGFKFIFYHRSDCCETVSIEDIVGDLPDLLESPILQAEEVSNYKGPEMPVGSYTWTFYKFATISGSVTIRWLGTSNGYYSEKVHFKVIRP